MPDGRYLVLPLRQLPHAPDTAVSSIISTQVSFPVEHAIVDWMAEVARPLASDVVIGMPTLGLLYARALAERLGMSNWVALGYSRKFWYDETLSEPVNSVTSPGGSRRVYLDPRMLERLEGRRAIIVDDVVSTGSTAASAISLVSKVDVTIVGIVAGMLQGDRWRSRLAEIGPEWPGLVRGAFATPLFRKEDDGWHPRLDTCISEQTLSGA